MRYSYMICPAHDLGVNVFSNVECEVNPVFHWQRYAWPDFLNRIINLTVSITFGAMEYRLNILLPVWLSTSRCVIYTIPFASTRHGNLRIACGAVWRVLCQWIQTRF